MRDYFLERNIDRAESSRALPSPADFVPPPPALPLAQPAQSSDIPPLYMRRETDPDVSSGVQTAVYSLLPLMLVGFGVRRRRTTLKKRRLMRRYRRHGDCEVIVISMAFRPKVRRVLQDTLKRLGRTADMQSAEGMHAAAQAVTTLLVRNINEMEFATWSSRQAWSSAAGDVFATSTRGLKSRYRHDVLRGSTKAFEAKAHEGEGWVVVSVVAGAMRTFHRGEVQPGRESLARELVRIVQDTTPAQLVAFETIWSPAEELDRMSAAELSLLYPELLPLADAPPQIAQCGYCDSLYTAELETCPTCGAPEEARRG